MARRTGRTPALTPALTPWLTPLNAALAQTGMRVLTSISDLPQLLIDDIKPALPSAHVSTGADGWLAVAQGIGDALRSMSDAGGFQSVLATWLKANTPIMALEQHSSDSADALMTAAMGTYEGKLPRSMVLVNTRFAIKENFRDGYNTVGGLEYAKVIASGGSEDDAIRVLYKFSAWHEFAHIADFFTHSYLSTALQIGVQLRVGEGKPLYDYLQSNVSNYATTTPSEALGEVMSMKYGGLQVPAKLQFVTNAFDKLKIRAVRKATDPGWDRSGINVFDILHGYNTPFAEPLTAEPVATELTPEPLAKAA